MDSMDRMFEMYEASIVELENKLKNAESLLSSQLKTIQELEADPYKGEWKRKFFQVEAQLTECKNYKGWSQFAAMRDERDDYKDRYESLGEDYEVVSEDEPTYDQLRCDLDSYIALYGPLPAGDV
jgi:chromosome segregation ATPase